MRWYVVLWSFVMLLFVVQAVPTVCEAEPAPGQVKKKKKRKKKRARRARKKARKAKQAKQQQAAQAAAAANGEAAAADADDELEQEAGAGDEQVVREQEGSLRTSSGRMEFDERLVKGQAAKSGAVYLFKRVPRQLPGLVPMRRSYRKRIVEPVLGICTLKPAIPSGKVDRPSVNDVAEQEGGEDEDGQLSSDSDDASESESKEEP